MFTEQRFRGHNLSLNCASNRDSGPAIVFLHGVARRWQDMTPLFPYFENSWCCCALDFRGHGRSNRAEKYCVIDYVADVRDFLAAEFRESVVIYGHSLGAMVALALAAEIPELVRAIVLEDPPFHTMGKNIEATSYHAMFQKMMSLAGSRENVAQALADFKIRSPDGSERRLGDLRSAESLRHSAECLAFVDPAVFRPLIESRWLDGFDHLNYFSRVNCPALLLQADPQKGGAFQEADADATQARTKKCVREKLSCGHLMHWDQTESVARTTNNFLRTL
jgi:pimeloyl-ACP methyl ester carboxylesterase